MSAPTVDTSPDSPADRGVDRRSFLTRMSVLAAVGAASTVSLPVVAHAETTTSRSLPPGGVRPEVLADLSETTVAEAIALIRSGRITPELLVEAYLDRIGAFDDTLQAFNTVVADDALARARALAGRPVRGLLHGIPLAIKDNYYTAGVETTVNSFAFEGFVPPFDATAVARLVGAGGIVLGKTQMGPLATTRATTPAGVVTTVNAWTPTNPATNPGGSSSGSATSVAARMATSSVGTQTGGSITAPSNAQNLTGLKPTMGRVSLYGIVPLSYTRDHPGPLARDVMDAAIMLQAMAGPDPEDPRTLGLPPVPDLVRAATPVGGGRTGKVRWRTRVGVIPGYADGTGETALARQAFLATLARVDGVEVVEVPFPEDWALLTNGSFNNVRLPERTEPFLPLMRQDLRLLGVSATGWLQGAMLGATEFLTGQRAKALLLQRVLDDTFSRCDVVLQTSPNPFDAIGLPELALPIGFTAGGLPIGTILGGLPFGEDRLLALGAAYQSVSDWHLRRPADPPGEAPTPVAVTGPRRPGRLRVTGRRGAPAARPERGRLTAAEVAAAMQ